MEPTNAATKRASQPISPVEWLLFAGALALLCAHTYAVWSATPWFILTQPVVWIAALVVLIGFCLGLGESLRKVTENTSRLSRVMGGTLLLLFALFLLSPLPNYIKDGGIRHRIHAVSNEAQLLAWAEQLFRTPLERLPIREQQGNIYWLDASKLPDYVRSIPQIPYQDFCYRLIDEGPKGRYLEISVWQGRPQSWGILLCTPTFRPEGLKDRWIRRWRDGLYGWQQLNAIS